MMSERDGDGHHINGRRRDDFCTLPLVCFGSNDTAGAAVLLLRE